MRVQQILSGAGPQDAITSEALAFRGVFESWGWAGRDWAARIAPGLNGAMAPLKALDCAPEDVLLLHHSAATPGLRELLALPNPKLLLYHNVTPPQFLWDHAPVVAVHCAIGREQLGMLVDAVDVAAADSAFNASELSELGAEAVQVIPLLIDPERLGPPGGEPDGPPVVLFVGRLSPHKRQDEIIRAFSLYRRERSPQARLVLVGDAINPEYAALLAALAERLAPGAVTIESGLSQQRLAERYREAHVLLCLSEHEGFCIPLVEAFHFGVPVVARPAGAVAEVVGDAALLVEDQDPAVIAELLHLVVSDAGLRAELVRRGHARLAAYSTAHVEALLREAVERAAGQAAGQAAAARPRSSSGHR